MNELWNHWFIGSRASSRSRAQRPAQSLGRFEQLEPRYALSMTVSVTVAEVAIGGEAFYAYSVDATYDSHPPLAAFAGPGAPGQPGTKAAFQVVHEGDIQPLPAEPYHEGAGFEDSYLAMGMDPDRLQHPPHEFGWGPPPSGYGPNSWFGSAGNSNNNSNASSSNRSESNSDNWKTNIDPSETAPNSPQLAYSRGPAPIAAPVTILQVPPFPGDAPNPINSRHYNYIQLLESSDVANLNLTTSKISTTATHDLLFQNQSFDSLLLAMDGHATDRATSEIGSTLLDESGANGDSKGLVSLDQDELLHGDAVAHDMINVEREAVDAVLRHLYSPADSKNNNRQSDDAAANARAVDQATQANTRQVPNSQQRVDLIDAALESEQGGMVLLRAGRVFDSHNWTLLPTARPESFRDVHVAIDGAVGIYQAFDVASGEPAAAIQVTDKPLTTSARPTAQPVNTSASERTESTKTKQAAAALGLLTAAASIRIPPVSRAAKYATWRPRTPASSGRSLPRAQSSGQG